MQQVELSDDTLNMIGLYLSNLEKAHVEFSVTEIYFQNVLQGLWDNTPPDQPALVDFSVVTDMHDYFADRAGVEDGDYGEPHPNSAMAITNDLAFVIITATKDAKRADSAS